MMPKTAGIAALILGGMAAGALADVNIDQLLVRRKGEDVNIRVQIRNPGVKRQAGPVLIDLYVRDNASLPWEKIRTWKDISVIKPGDRIARDFFEENNVKLRDLAADGAFQARAVVTLPNGAKGAETTYSWQDKEK